MAWANRRTHRALVTSAILLRNSLLAACALTLAAAGILVLSSYLGPRTAQGQGTGQCAGDCDSDGIVQAREIFAATARQMMCTGAPVAACALGTVSVPACAPADDDGDGAITDNDVVAAIYHSISGCPAADEFDAATLSDNGGALVVAGAVWLVPPGVLSDSVDFELRRLPTSPTGGYDLYSRLYELRASGSTEDFAGLTTLTFDFTGDSARAAVFCSWPEAAGFERIGGRIVAPGKIEVDVTRVGRCFVADGLEYTDPPDRSCAVTRLLDARVLDPQVPSGVALFFTADDCEGRPLTDLMSTDFVIKEDDRNLSFEAAATVLPQPGLQVFVNLVLDMSSSTASVLPELKAAAAEFVRRLQVDRTLPVQISVQVFSAVDDSNTTPTWWQRATLAPQTLLDRIEQLDTLRPDSKTDLYGAVLRALDGVKQEQQLFRARNYGGAFTTGYLAVFTDGRDTVNPARLDQARNAVAEARSCTGANCNIVETYAVALSSPDLDGQAVDDLRNLVGSPPRGRSPLFFAPDRDTLSREFAALANVIAGQIRRSYLLGYCSAAAEGSHTVTVELDNPTRGTGLDVGRNFTISGGTLQIGGATNPLAELEVPMNAIPAGGTQRFGIISSTDPPPQGFEPYSAVYQFTPAAYDFAGTASTTVRVRFAGDADKAGLFCKRNRSESYQLVGGAIAPNVAEASNTTLFHKCFVANVDNFLADATARYTFSANGFDAGACLDAFAHLCDDRECGGFGCGACDDRVAGCDPQTFSCTDFCTLAGRCGGDQITNPRGYAQVCQDRPPEWVRCGAACRNLLTDSSNCRVCGNVCDDAEVCCNGACVDLGTDERNCGACGTGCTAGNSCCSGSRPGAISSGSQASCAVDTEGRVECWGRNHLGQTTVPDDLGAALQVGTDRDHACALEKTGTIKCWGSNDNGVVDAPSDVSDAVQLSVGYAHACLVRMDGRVRCWGRDRFGYTIVPDDLGKVKQVSVGNGHTCAVTVEDAVRCWLYRGAYETNVPGDLGKVVQVSTGSAHACAMRTDGSVRCWGNDNYLQSSVPIDLGPVRQVSAGATHTCALLADRTVRCWGDYGVGDTGISRQIPPFDLGPVHQVSSGSTHTCAVRLDGTVRCWGSNLDHQLEVSPALGLVGGQGQCEPIGICTRCDSSSECTPGLDCCSGTCVDVAQSHQNCMECGNPCNADETCCEAQCGELVGDARNCGACGRSCDAGEQCCLGTDGTVLSAAATFACAVDTAGTVKCWGRRQGVPEDLQPAKQVSAGEDHMCALGRNGIVQCWGANDYGQSLVPADLGPAIQVDAEDDFTCAVRVDHTVRCWGYDFFGRTSVPGDLVNVERIAVVSGCAILVDGTLRCWGNSPPAVPADLGPVIDVAVPCAIRTDGTIRCWEFSRLAGDWGPVTQIDSACLLPADGYLRCPGSPSFVPHDLGRISQFTIGGRFACAVRVGGGVRCWGANTLGETDVPPLGEIGASACVATGECPTCEVAAQCAVGSDCCDGYCAPLGEDERHCGACGSPCDGHQFCCGGACLDLTTDEQNCGACGNRCGAGQTCCRASGVGTLSAGSYHACAVMADGQIRCWGQQGVIAASVPASVTPAVAVSVGELHTCALLVDGTIACWGFDDHGQTMSRSEVYRQLSAGWSHNCAVRQDGTVDCWGSNQSGQSNVPLDLGQVRQVSAGASMSCAVKLDGSVRCWGVGAEPPEDLGPVEQISVGGGRACAVKADRTLRCWGETVPDGLTRVNHVSVGPYRTCVVRLDRTVACWGDGGVLLTDVPTDLGPVVYVTAGSEQTCALTTDGGVRCWGGDIAPPADLAPAGRGYCAAAGTCATCGAANDCGSGNDCLGGACSCGSPQRSCASSEICCATAGSTALSAGDAHTCAMTASGTALCWGLNASVPADLGGITQIESGSIHSCAVLTNGTVRCWGRNDEGQIDVPSDLGSVRQISAGRHTCAVRELDGQVRCWGRNDNMEADVPNDVGPVRLISSGFTHTCAVREDRSVRCWGSNDAGQTDVPADLGPVRQVSGGSNQTCAVRDNGLLACWGGRGNDVPAAVGTARQVSVGGLHTCAVRSDRSVHCWGNDNFGQISDLPPDLGTVRLVTAGLLHTCAIRTDNSVRCWGFNQAGQVTVPPNLTAGTARECADGQDDCL